MNNPSLRSGILGFLSFFGYQQLADFSFKSFQKKKKKVNEENPNQLKINF